MNYLATAVQQRDNHLHQVSGAWSINAKDFCEELDIDDIYEKAIEYQTDMEYRDNEEFEAELVNKYTKDLGYLTDEQLNKISNLTDGVGVNDDGYSVYFWDYIVMQLQEEN